MSEPQPPSGDQPPMSGSQPPTDPPPAAPVNPYDTAAASAPPPQEPTPPTQPDVPYGTPQLDPSYGTPAPGMVVTGGVPGVPGAAPEPSKAMAITALVLSLLCCTPVAFILSLLVLRKSRDGRDHGKGLAIAAMVISVVFSIGIGLVAYGISQIDWDDLNPVSDLESGDCFNAEDLLAGKTDVLIEEEVDCGEPHDAQTLVAIDMTADQAEAYPSDLTICDTLVAEAGFVPSEELALNPLTIREAPNAGDPLACVAYRTDGAKLTEVIAPAEPQ